MATTGTTVPNSSVTSDDSTTSVLTYVVGTNPEIVCASASNSAPTLVDCTVVITNPSGAAVNVQSINFGFPVGTDATDLIINTGNIVAVQPDQNWTISSPPSSMTSGTASYILQPANSSFVVMEPNTALSIQFNDLPINSLTGSAQITITEKTVTNTGASSPNVPNTGASSPNVPNTGATITKYPPGFFFNGLFAGTLNGSTISPVAQVKNGTPVTLVWNVSKLDPSAIQICYSSPTNGQVITSPSQLSQWTSPALTCDTVFTVSATSQGAGGQPVTLVMSTAVSVASPTLVAGGVTATSLAVSGTASVSEATALSGTLSVSGATTLSNTLSVSEATTLSNTLSVSGATTFSNTLNVSGNGSVTTLDSGAVINNGAEISGSATINGSARINGGLLVNPNGPVSILNSAPQNLNIGPAETVSYLSFTDGFLIGSVQAPTTVTADTLAVGWMNATTNGVSMYATGGNFYCAPAGSNLTAGVNGSWCLPVCKGGTVQVTTSQLAGTAVPLNFTLQWIPMGGGNLAQEPS